MAINIKNENQDKYELAKEYFLAGLTQAEIGNRVGISQPTLKEWINKGKWKDLKNISGSTRSVLLQSAYKQLAAIDERLAKNNWISNKEDNDAKSHALKQIALFEDVPIRVFIDCFEDFLKYVGKEYPNKKTEIANICHDFVAHLQNGSK